ncbi:uncharacterized protein LOC135272288 [Aotus nancymaae]|uniref:uncharacterized protein LOC135272288 n=1 Tax=Aotus nancymaae TaxID=37293 RepID=UPI0030FE05F9
MGEKARRRSGSGERRPPLREQSWGSNNATGVALPAPPLGSTASQIDAKLRGALLPSPRGSRRRHRPQARRVPRQSPPCHCGSLSAAPRRPLLFSPPTGAFRVAPPTAGSFSSHACAGRRRVAGVS